MRKKLVFILTIAALLLGLVACSGGNKKPEVTPDEDIEEVEGTGELVIKANKDMPRDIVCDPSGEKEVDLKAYFTVRYRRLKKEITDEMLDDGGFDIKTPGTYTVVVSALDPDQNVVKSDKVKLRVIAEDTTPPKIYPNPEYGFEFTAGHKVEEFYSEFGFETVDNVDGRKKFTDNSAFTGLEAIDPNKLGEYDVSISVSDEAGNVTAFDFKVRVVDNEAPIIFVVDNISTPKGTPVDIMEKLNWSDNYYPKEDIEITYKVRTQEYDEVYSELLFVDAEINRVRNRGLSPDERQKETERLNKKKEEIQKKLDKLIEGNKKYVDEVDFNQLGEHNIEIFAVDPSGNKSSIDTPRTFKVIVTDNPSFGTIIVVVNAIALGVALIGVGVAMAIIIPRIKSKKAQESENNK